MKSFTLRPDTVTHTELQFYSFRYHRTKEAKTKAIQRIQAIGRGRLARKDTHEVKARKGAAATRIQSIHRRRQVERRHPLQRVAPAIVSQSTVGSTIHSDEIASQGGSHEPRQQRYSAHERALQEELEGLDEELKTTNAAMEARRAATQARYDALQAAKSAYVDEEGSLVTPEEAKNRAKRFLVGTAQKRQRLEDAQAEATVALQVSFLPHALFYTECNL